MNSTFGSLNQLSSDPRFPISEAYLSMRHLPIQDNFKEPHFDTPEYASRPPPELGRVFSTVKNTEFGADALSMNQSKAAHVRANFDQFEKMYYNEQAKTKNLKTEIEELRSQQTRLNSEKETIKKGYEEFISRMNSELLELKRSEQKLEETLRLKSKLEIDLELASQQLAQMRDGGGDQIAAELRRVVARLVEEKKQLRAALSAHEIEISKLTVLVTTLRESNGDGAGLQLKLNQLQSSYNMLLREYNELKSRPILAPQNKELENLLREKVTQVQILEQKVGELNQRLKDQSIEMLQCRMCKQKDETISSLSSQLKSAQSYRATSTEYSTSFRAPLQPIVQKISYQRPYVSQQSVITGPQTYQSYQPIITQPVQTYASTACCSLACSHRCKSVMNHTNCCCCCEYGNSTDASYGTVIKDGSYTSRRISRIPMNLSKNITRASSVEVKPSYMVGVNEVNYIGSRAELYSNSFGKQDQFTIVQPKLEPLYPVTAKIEGSAPLLKVNEGAYSLNGSKYGRTIITQPQSEFQTKEVSYPSQSEYSIRKVENFTNSFGNYAVQDTKQADYLNQEPLVPLSTNIPFTIEKNSIGRKVIRSVSYAPPKTIYIPYDETKNPLDMKSLSQNPPSDFKLPLQTQYYAEQPETIVAKSEFKENKETKILGQTEKIQGGFDREPMEARIKKPRLIEKVFNQESGESEIADAF